MQLKTLLFFIGSLISLSSLGQDAKLSAVITSMITGSRLITVRNIEFRINDQYFKFGSPAVSVTPDPYRMDTLFYRLKKESEWDTILCNFRKPYLYTITYNICCDGFNISSEDTPCPMPEIIFQVEHNKSKKSYIGSYEGTGVLISKNQNRLTSTCNHSAMAPNIQLIEFSEVVICSDSSDCNSSVCLYEKTKMDYNYNFRYKTVSKKFSYPFMPLGEQTLHITYDPTNDQIKIR